jgi:3-oxoacyl-[acyl-carrier protein] reductase
MIDPGLKGKVALVTGANHGIGAATARALAACGVDIFAAYYRPQTDFSEAELKEALEKGETGERYFRARQQQSIEPLLEELLSMGVEAEALEADLGEADQTRRLFDSCEGRLGPVDVLVCNHTHDTLETFDPARVTWHSFGVAFQSAGAIDRHFSVNTRAYALLIAEYAQRYLKREATWGRIITISTDASHAHPANVNYAASKHAIESYARSAASELGRYGITVNVVSPGPTQTGYIAPDFEKELAEGTPLKRIGHPDDVADVITFLSSEQARWITGQLIYVGGGWRMPQ